MYRKIYDPAAFEERLLGNLSRFHQVRYRPERPRMDNFIILLRLLTYYFSKGWRSTKFFFKILWKTLRHSPRSVRPMIIFLGMFKHCCEVHGKALSWDPWSKDGNVPREETASSQDNGQDQARAA